MKGLVKWLLYFLSAFIFPLQAETLNVGSKRFTESYILGEILIRAAGDAVYSG